MRSAEGLWLLCLLLALSATNAFRIFFQRRLQMPAAVEMNCYEIPLKLTATSPSKLKSEAWRLQKKVQFVAVLPTTSISTAAPPALQSALNTHEIQKRFDHLITEGNDIVKEHAKLVQDINGLRQLVYIAPLADEKDYDESVFHEIIETSSTTTTRPSSTRPPNTRSPFKPARPTGFPLILTGSSQRYTVRAPPTPTKVPRPTISLVGSSASPLVKHPYPFVGQASSQRPYKVCMPTMPMYPATTPRPSLLTRLLSFFPRLTG